jgi:acetyl-CoA C-acetyltransferase
MAETDKDIVIVSAVRTPFGRYGGALKEIDYYELGSLPMKEVLRRVNLGPEVVDQVYWGVGDTTPCKDPFTPVPARQSLLKAGLRPETTSLSLDMACVSAMHAVKLAGMALKLGEARAVIAGGATSFSRVPLVVRGLRFEGYRMGDVKMEDPLLALGYKDFNPVAVDTDNVAAEWGIGRGEQDEWAARSHQNYGRAHQAGKFQDELMTLTLPQKKGEPVTLAIDEQYRADTSAEKLARLHPVYGTRAITAGNAPGLNDGATAVLVMRRERARELGLTPLGTVVAQISLAIAPHRMPEGPGYALQKILAQAGLTMDDISVMEINEAFAAVPLVSTAMLAGGDKAKLKHIREKTNINGSAIAIGHPNTASGARVMMNLLYELRRRGGGYALGAICGGLAQADAALIQVG